MAEAWIRVVKGLSKRPVVMRLAALVKGNRHEAMGLLVEFWSNVSDHARNGFIRDYEDHYLETWADWKGKRGVFARWVREHHMDELTVLAEVRHDLSNVLTERQRGAIATEVRHQIKSSIGVSADVHILETDRIERTQVGKAKRVIDKRPKATA